jgi:hypothetical protein
MRTFTFITYANDLETAEATVALRGELHGSNMVGITPLRPRTTRHLDRFVAGRNWHITAICQIDAASLADAADVMGITR